MVRIKSTSEQIYDYIVRQIEIGALVPDEPLIESKLIELFNTSRTPIREAMIRLTSDGIVYNAKRKGFFVRGFSKTDVMENYYIISCLDSYAAVLAMANMTSEDIHRLEMIELRLELAIQQREYEVYHDEQVSFHKTYYEKSGNRNLADLILSLQKKNVRTPWFRGEEDTFNWLIRVNDDHKQIIECFKNKDKEGLVSVIFSHWISSEKRPIPIITP